MRRNVTFDQWSIAFAFARLAQQDARRALSKFPHYFKERCDLAMDSIAYMMEHLHQAISETIAANPWIVGGDA